jgi:hypothetical protein
MAAISLLSFGHHVRVDSKAIITLHIKRIHRKEQLLVCTIYDLPLSSESRTYQLAVISQMLPGYAENFIGHIDRSRFWLRTVT